MISMVAWIRYPGQSRKIIKKMVLGSSVILSPERGAYYNLRGSESPLKANKTKKFPDFVSII